MDCGKVDPLICVAQNWQLSSMRATRVTFPRFFSITCTEQCSVDSAGQ